MLDLFSTVVFCSRAGNLSYVFSGGFAIVWLSWSLPTFCYHRARLTDLFSSRIQSTQKAIHSPVSVPMMLSTSGRAPLNIIHSSGNAIRTLLNAFLVYTLREDYTFSEIPSSRKKKQASNFTSTLVLLDLWKQYTDKINKLNIFIKPNIVLGKCFLFPDLMTCGNRKNLIH